MTMPMRGRAVFLATVLLATTAVAARAQAVLTAEQVVELRAVRSVAVSPDGRRVAYTLLQPRSDTAAPGPAYTELWVVEAGGGEPTPVVVAPASAGSPRWSPDGEWLGFILRPEGRERPQVHAVPAEGGPMRRLTDSATGVLAFEWSPQGDAIAYTAWNATPAAVTARRATGNDVVVAGEGRPKARLWLQELDGSGAEALTPPHLHVAAFAWSPAGNQLAVQASAASDADSDLMRRDLWLQPADGRAPRELTPTPGKLGAMAWSPDGRFLAYLGATAANDPLAQSVLVVPATGGEPRNLTPAFEGSATDVAWLDNEHVAFVAAEGTRTTLNRVRAAGGPIERIAGGGAEVFGAVSFDARARTFAVAASTARHPAAVFAGDVGSGRLRRLVDPNPWLDTVALGRQETIAWQSSDGLRIEGVVVYPVGYAGSTRYPLAILPHGGPEGISQDGWTTSALYPAQVLAGRGYVVLMPNYRGSGGRGVAFSQGDHRDLGGLEFDDVLAGIDALAARGVVDPARVGISGTSYGGYLSAWAATRHGGRFRAAIPFAGIANWTSFTYTTDIPEEMSVAHWDLWCDEHAELCWERSPVAHVNGASTPTLIGHGLADERVHPAQSLELFTALRLEGVPVELVHYPREPHGLLERAHQLDYMERIVRWMDRYLKEREAS